MRWLVGRGVGVGRDLDSHSISKGVVRSFNPGRIGARPQGLQREETPVNAFWDGHSSILGYPKKRDPGHHPETHHPAGSIRDRGKLVHVQQVL